MIIWRLVLRRLRFPPFLVENQNFPPQSTIFHEPHMWCWWQIWIIMRTLKKERKSIHHHILCCFARVWSRYRCSLPCFHGCLLFPPDNHKHLVPPRSSSPGSVWMIPSWSNNSTCIWIFICCMSTRFLVDKSQVLKLKCLQKLLDSLNWLNTLIRFSCRAPCMTCCRKWK